MTPRRLPGPAWSATTRRRKRRNSRIHCFHAFVRLCHERFVKAEARLQDRVGLSLITSSNFENQARVMHAAQLVTIVRLQPRSDGLAVEDLNRSIRSVCRPEMMPASVPASLPTRSNGNAAIAHRECRPGCAHAHVAPRKCQSAGAHSRPSHTQVRAGLADQSARHARSRLERSKVFGAGRGHQRVLFQSDGSGRYLQRKFQKRDSLSC